MVYAEAEDLAVIKQAAARSDVSEAEIIRNAIHLAALRLRRRSEPLALRRFDSGDPTLADRVDEFLADDGDDAHSFVDESGPGRA